MAGSPTGSLAAGEVDGTARPPGGWRAYLRLGNLTFPTNFLGAVLCWTLLPAAIRFELRTALLLGLGLALFVAWVACGSALDDLGGFRDGSDRHNYLGAADERRSVAGKPLLTGELSEADAVRFAGATFLLAVTLFGGSWAVNGFSPAWYPLWCVVAFGMLTYSWGARVSYRGLQEVVLWAAPFASVAFPFGLVTGTLSAEAAVAAALYGWWMVQVALFANIHDIDGDRAAGRITWAARLTPVVYRRLVFAVFLLQWAFAAVAAFAGWIEPWRAALVLAAVGPLQLRQLRDGLLRGDVLSARKTGFLAILIGVVTTCLAELV